MAKMTKKNIQDAYREEAGTIKAPDAKAIMDRNEKVFVEIMGDVMKVLTTIKQSKDYEFKLVICNTLSDQFRNYGFMIALNKITEMQSLIPKNHGTAKPEFIDKAVG
jgi:hypothetical protein